MEEVLYPLEIKRVTLEDAGRTKSNGFTGKGFVKYLIRVGPEGYILTNQWESFLPKIYCMEIRPDDIFVMTFPKSGTTWAQELVWLIANDLDYETAKTVLLDHRFPLLMYTPEMSEQELNSFTNTGSQETCGRDKASLSLATIMKNTGLDAISQMPSTRFIKNHLPFSLLPPGLIDKAKVVYVARDPRDVAVSFYYFHKMANSFEYNGDFKQFWKLFRNNLVNYCPYFAHFKEAWELRNHPNMLFLFYEELSKDMPNVIRRVAKFFGKTVTEKEIAKLCEHLEFDNFRKNKSVNKDELKQCGIFEEDGNFIRRGKAGGWRDYFDEEMRRDAEAWMEEGFKGINCEFPF